MKIGTGWLIGVAGVGVAMVALSTKRLATFAQEFEIIPTGRIHQISYSGVMLAIDVTFKNPTDLTVLLKHPTLKLYDENPEQAYDKKTGKALALPSAISVSDLEPTTYSIKPNTQTKLHTIYMPITWLAMGGQFRKLLYLGKNIVLYVRATTQINGIGIPPQVRSFPINLYPAK